MNMQDGCLTLVLTLACPAGQTEALLRKARLYNAQPALVAQAVLNLTMAEILGDDCENALLAELRSERSRQSQLKRTDGKRRRGVLLAERHVREFRQNRTEVIA